jgi:hypothetical protein
MRLQGKSGAGRGAILLGAIILAIAVIAIGYYLLYVPK